jgi:PadR family transcriptional regulator, regulatory protein PadR
MRADDLRGRLDAMILATVEHRPLHGYAVMEELRERSGGQLELPTGTVYPALRRLERAHEITGEWQTVGGRKRRTYRITESGRRLLATERAAWADYSRLMGVIIGGRP